MGKRRGRRQGRSLPPSRCALPPSLKSSYGGQDGGQGRMKAEVGRCSKRDGWGGTPSLKKQLPPLLEDSFRLRWPATPGQDAGTRRRGKFRHGWRAGRNMAVPVADGGRGGLPMLPGWRGKSGAPLHAFAGQHPIFRIFRPGFLPAVVVLEGGFIYPCSLTMRGLTMSVVFGGCEFILWP
jgi:hypothetical protein